MAEQVADFQPMLEAAIAEAKAAGLVAAASQLEGRAFSAYATSSELLGETVQDFLREARRLHREDRDS